MTKTCSLCSSKILFCNVAVISQKSDFWFSPTANKITDCVWEPPFLCEWLDEIHLQCFVISIKRWHEKTKHTCERLGTGRSCSILHTRPAVRACSAVSNLTPYWTGKTSCGRVGEGTQYCEVLCLEPTAEQRQFVTTGVLSTHLEEDLPLCGAFQQALDQHHEVGLGSLHLDVLLTHPHTHTTKCTVAGAEWTKGPSLQTRPTLTSAVAETFSLFMRPWMALESGGPSLCSKSKIIWRKNKTAAKSWTPPQGQNTTLASHLPHLTC